MAPAAVYLHIGSPKTATTFVHATLWANRAVWENDGILVPGHSRVARTGAVRDLLAWDPASASQAPTSWRRLVAEVNRWEGRAAIISQEFLCLAGPEHIAAIVGSFPQSQVHAVLTVRDLARLVPSQWQTSMRQRRTWTLAEYVDGVTGISSTGKAERAARHFWRRQDYGPILARWVDTIGPDHVSVVTVPPSGGDPNELWLRFCRACELNPERTVPGKVSHESLGAASAEVMRRLNDRPDVAKLPMDLYHKSVTLPLSRRVLGPRRQSEPALTLPEIHREWAGREASRLITDIEVLGVRVYGGLDDLRPRLTTQTSVAPDELPAEVLLEAALDGLAGLAVQNATVIKNQRRAERKSRAQATVAPVRGSRVSRIRSAWRGRRPQ